MNDRERRIYEAGVRTSAFITAYYNDLKDYPAVPEIKTELTRTIETLAGLGTEKVTKTGAARDATLHRGDARDYLLDLMRNIYEMWKRIGPKIGGDINKFRMPWGSDRNLLATAESFADQAEPIKNEFIKRAFKADFIETLRTAIADFAETVNESDTARRQRVGTNAALEAPVKICKELIADLDPIVKMHFRDNPRVLAEWLVASHIERAARKNGSAAPKDPALPELDKQGTPSS